MEPRSGSRGVGWHLAGFLVAVLGLIGLFWQGAWLIDVCVLSESGACWIGRPLPGHEASLATVGAAAGVAGVWAISAGVRRQRRAVTGMVLAFGLAGVGRWWAGPQTPFSDAWLTDHHPLLVWFGVTAGVGAASVTWAWCCRRSTIWAVAAATTIGALVITLIGSAYGVSHLE